MYIFLWIIPCSQTRGGDVRVPHKAENEIKEIGPGSTDRPWSCELAPLHVSDVVISYLKRIKKPIDVLG